MFDEPSDEILAARVATHDLGAFAQLYDRHAARIHAWAAHVLGADAADDAVQEVFLRVWDKARQFDPTRGTFATWLAAIARHHVGAQAARLGRQRVRATADDVGALLAERRDEDDVEAMVLARDDERRVADVLATLPVEQRRVLVLGYFFGMSQSEMARALALPLGTVKKRVRLGMQKLRLAFADERATAHLRVVVDK